LSINGCGDWQSSATTFDEPSDLDVP
jgi:hypothetical protein